MTDEQLDMIISYIEVNHDILTSLDILEGLCELRENNRKEGENQGEVQSNKCYQ